MTSADNGKESSMNSSSHELRHTRGRSAPSGAELIGLGGLLAGAVVAPLLAGLVLDSLLRSAPLFLLIGIVVGILAAGVAVYSRFRPYL